MRIQRKKLKSKSSTAPKVRKVKDVSGIKYYDYYRELLKWCRKQPMPPRYPAKLEKLRAQFGGPKRGRTGAHFTHGREELKTSWNTFATALKAHQEKYEQWLADRPQRNGVVFKLSDNLIYTLETGLTATKETIETLERPKQGTGLTRLKHPLTGKMLTVLEIRSEKQRR